MTLGQFFGAATFEAVEANSGGFRGGLDAPALLAERDGVRVLSHLHCLDDRAVDEKQSPDFIIAQNVETTADAAFPANVRAVAVDVDVMLRMRRILRHGVPVGVECPIDVLKRHERNVHQSG